MADSVYEIRLQGNKVVIFIMVEWIFILMKRTTMIPYELVSEEILLKIWNEKEAVDKKQL